MLCCTETVTLYHRDYNPASRSDVWSRTVYPTASWYGGQAAPAGDNDRVTADAYTVRIDTDAEITAAPGDVLVLGEVEDAVTGSSVLTRKYQGRCMVLTSVRDNRRGARRLWHWKLEGK